MHLHLIVNFIKYKLYRTSTTKLCIILLILLAVMDYGMVSYFSKEEYVYFMCLFLQSEFVKNDKFNHRSRKNNI